MNKHWVSHGEPRLLAFILDRKAKKQSDRPYPTRSKDKYRLWLAQRMQAEIDSARGCHAGSQTCLGGIVDIFLPITQGVEFCSSWCRVDVKLGSSWSRGWLHMEGRRGSSRPRPSPVDHDVHCSRICPKAYLIVALLFIASFALEYLLSGIPFVSVDVSHAFVHLHSVSLIQLSGLKPKDV